MPSYKVTSTGVNAYSLEGSRHIPDMKYPEGISPFGVQYDSINGTMKPASFAMKFFVLPPFVKATPECTYSDLIEAYKFYRSHISLEQGKGSTGLIASSVEEEMVNFQVYWDKVKVCGILPEWWDEVENEPEIMRLAREDKHFKITKPFDINTYRWYGSPKSTRDEKWTQRLGPIGERVYGRW